MFHIPSIDIDQNRDPSRCSVAVSDTIQVIYTPFPGVFVRLMVLFALSAEHQLQGGVTEFSAF